MADTKISALPAGVMAAGIVLAGVAGGVTSKFTGADVASYTIASDVEIAAVAGLTSAADALPYYTGSGTAATTTLTSAARTVLDDTTVGAMVNTLGGATSTGTGGLVRLGAPTFTGIPVLADPTATTLTLGTAGLHLLDTNASHDLVLTVGTNLTADRAFTVTTGDADRALTISSDTTLGGGSHSGTNTGDQSHADTMRVLRTLFLQGSTATDQLSAGRTYAVYLGYLAQSKLLKHIEFHVGVVGAGTQTAEVALASSPLAPNKSGQTLTMLVADGTLDSLTVGTTVKRNTTAFSAGAGYTVAAGTHLWGLIRTDMGALNPEIYYYPNQVGNGWGHQLYADGVGALTSMTTAAFSLATGNATAGRVLVATMD